MKRPTRALRLLTVAVLALVLVSAGRPSAAETDNGEPETNTGPTYQNYSGLADLITMICDGALDRFAGFYGPGVVRIEPFPTIGYYERNKLSELGLTLADQMTAAINNDTLTANSRVHGLTGQRLEGVLQEIDGYLRIRMSGLNAAGERTSYVVNVEMSEPIYRALHTYL